MILWLWLACTGEDSTKVVEPERTLLTASQEVIFASTELLGPHRFRSVFEQTEFHGEDVRNTHREVLSIDWMDWDHWQATHMVEDDVVMQVIVMDTQCLEQVSGKFIKRPDGEPYRVQLRSMWNQWDSIMRHFEPYSVWTDNGPSVMEGRTVHHYTAVFTEPQNAVVGLTPMELDAQVWVDEQTAVRLAGSVEASLMQGPYKKSVSLKVERSDMATDAVERRLTEEWSKIQVLQE